MLKFHPDKAPLGKEEEYTEKAARANRAKEIILRAQGLSDDGDSPADDRFAPTQCANHPLLLTWMGYAAAVEALRRGCVSHMQL
jgi:hypothetical protein